jgi:hypothetical protein
MSIPTLSEFKKVGAQFVMKITEERHNRGVARQLAGNVGDFTDK